MPTECFFNLSKEKQLKIIGAAVCELSEVPADKISINKIIRNAGISRGSFYQYFTDKYDLLDYILSGFKERIRHCFEENAEKYNGDIFQMTKGICEEIILMGKNESDLKIMKNFFLSIKFTRNDRMNILEIIGADTDFFPELIRPFMMKHKYRCDSEEFMFNVSEMMFLVVKQTLTDIFCDYQNSDIYMKDFYTQLDIIRHGAIEE